MTKQAIPKMSDNPFAEKQVTDNPFLAPPPPEAPEAPKLHEADESTPAWNTFVAFILAFGNVISRAEYPTPKGEVVDTIWQGVPVVDGAKARVKHKSGGWVDWANAVKGTDFE